MNESEFIILLALAFPGILAAIMVFLNDRARNSRSKKWLHWAKNPHLYRISYRPRGFIRGRT